jgi:hypothetical protein
MKKLQLLCIVGTVALILAARPASAAMTQTISVDASGNPVSASGASLLTTSTNLTIYNFATTSISQWNNDSAFIKSVSLAGLADTSFQVATSGTGINVSTSTSPSKLTISWTNPGYILSAPATTTINGAQTSTFYIVPGTGLTSTVSGATTTLSMATTAISQFTNDKSYLTTSTYNASMTISTAAPLSGGGSLSNNGTLALTLSTPLAATYGGTATTTALGTAAFVNIPLSIANGGTNTSTAPSTNSLLWYTGSYITSTTTVPISTSTYNASITILASSPLTGGGLLSNGGTISLGLSTPLTIANGGTNTSSAPAANSLLWYNGTSITATTTVLPSLPISIANGGTNTSSAPAANSFLWYNGTSYAATTTVPIVSSSIATTAPLGGGGSISNGGTLTLTCATCQTAALVSSTPWATNGIAYEVSGAAISASGTLTFLSNGGVSTTQLISQSTTEVGVDSFYGNLVATSTNADTVTSGSCGSSPTITGGNGRGQVVTGSNASSTCSITFGKAFTFKPRCFVSSESTSSVNYMVTPATGSLTISTASNTAMISNKLDYFCWGQ